ncbi:Crp/Fnr family transcriptional regulator [Ignavibacterium sp.]|uniref:Crp/Fnr family transcriptional regulator n=1 Tax=Ignavibacterium sp. TaxID=2651167 RepID=UPI00307E8A1C
MADKSKLWYLENFNLFSSLKQDSMMELNKISLEKEIGKNQPVYFPNEPSNSIFMLKTGRVKISRYSKDGKEMILAFINPGEVFGEMAYLGEEERTDIAIAVEPSYICAINKDDFSQFVGENPSLNLLMKKIIGLKLKNCSDRMGDLVFKDAKQRIISFLFMISSENGKKIGDQIIVKPFFKHQDIADITSCTRQVVNDVLTNLREKGTIFFDRKKLIVNRPGELKKLINN